MANPTDQRSRRQWAWLGLGLLVIASLLVGFFFLRPSSTPDSAATAPAAADAVAAGGSGFVNVRLRHEIEAQGLTVDRARQLFVVEVAPLPGVAPPAGDIRPTFSGTYALMQLMAVRNELTPDQRARLDELLDPNRSVLPSPLPPLPAARPRAPFALMAMYPPSMGARLMLAGLAPPPDDEQYRAYFRELYSWANTAVSTLTGKPKIPAFLLAFEEFTADNEKKAWALTTTWHNEQRYVADVGGTSQRACLSRVDIRKFLGWPVDVHLSVVVHEVVHCYQQIDSDTSNDVFMTHGWLTDGEATWAQMMIVPYAVFTTLQAHWREYLSTPRWPLFERNYDAAGFFGHVGDVAGADLVARRLIDVYHAGKQHNDESAYDMLVAGRSEEVLNTWAPSYFRTHELQFLWDAKGPGAGNMPAEKVQPHQLSVGPHDTVTLTHADPWELSLVTLDSSADVVTIVSSQGHVALIDRSEQVKETLRPFEPIALCLKGDCKCPAGTAGDVPPTVAALAKIDIGLTGGKTGADAYAHGESLEEYCQRKEQPSRPTGPEIPRGGKMVPEEEPHHGAVRSDPHIATIDGRWYDLQAIGEFVMARSTVDDFAVHARLGRLGAIETMSVVTSMGTRVGRDRVTVTLDRATSTPVLRINGGRATKDFVVLDGGSVSAVFNASGAGYIVEFDDGTRAGVTPFARNGLNLWLVPSAGRRGKLTGLLGDGDGQMDNDPTIRQTSTVLSNTPEYDELYRTFGNSWRVTDAESLLDYGPGESTATYTDKTFPARDVEPLDTNAARAAETTCRTAGITEEHLLQNCTFDIATTGDRRYLWSYVPLQQRHTFTSITAEVRRPPTGTGTVTSTAPSMRTRTVTLEGRVADASADAFAPFQAYKGDILYLDPDACLKPRFAQLQGPDAKAIGGAGISCGYRLKVPVDGTYHFALNPFHDFAGTYKMTLVAVRPDRITSFQPGDTLRGALNMRAEQDVFLLKVTSPGSLTIGGADCSANFDITMYFGDDELIGAGPACRMGTVTLPKAGTYRVVMNPYNAATGAYQIPTR